MGRIRGVRDQRAEMGRIRGGVWDQGAEMGRFGNVRWEELDLDPTPPPWILCSAMRTRYNYVIYYGMPKLT